MAAAAAQEAAAAARAAAAADAGAATAWAAERALCADDVRRAIPELPALLARALEQT